MARKDDRATDTAAAPEFSEADRKRAQQWFAKAADTRERREYDYAIECYITGLAYWPEAVEEGHMPLRSLAIQRSQVGGKKPGMMEQLKRSTSGKDHLKAMLNAEYLLSLDPQSASYAEALLKNAIKAGYLETAKWIAPIVFDCLKKDKKPSKARYKSYRDALVEGAHAADVRGEGPVETTLLDLAVTSIEHLITRTQLDDDLRNEQRDLAGKLTIARGKYEDADNFRDSLQDADKQKLLHDAERSRQAESTLQALTDAARKEWEAEPTSAAKINKYVEVLLKEEIKSREDEAIGVLADAYEKTQTYSFKAKADDIQLRQLARAARELDTKARKSNSDGDKQQARLAALELRQTTLDVYRERVANYPTDLRLKFRLGQALFQSGEYDEAIPMLQAATSDPRSRSRSHLMIGRAFFEKGNPAQAVEVLREAIDQYELTDDHSKELLYWLARSYEAADNPDEAKGTYGKLLRQDYNYLNGEARKRLENLG